jgi:hypothetical protein
MGFFYIVGHGLLNVAIFLALWIVHPVLGMLYLYWLFTH